MAHMVGKRKIESIDLTGSDDEVPSIQQPRKHQKQFLPTPPASSQLAPTQTSFNDWDKPSEAADEADAQVEIDSSQEFDDIVYSSLQLYGVISAKVVGIQYYRGHATVGEFVTVRREPTNPYDSNAIRIDNVQGEQIGHIPRRIAEKLAPFMDSKELFVEGALTANKGPFDVPFNLMLYGTSHPVEEIYLKARLKDSRLPTNELTNTQRERKQKEKQRKEQQRALKAAARMAGSQGSRTQFEDGSKGLANINVPSDDPTHAAEPSMEDILGTATDFNPRELSRVIDKYGAGEDKLSLLPFAEQPPSLSTQLLPYQLQGLAWMLDRENPVLPAPGTSDAVQLWKHTRGNMFTNIATNFTTTEPRLARGGILADDMGLGKTLQVIALLLSDERGTKQPTLIVSPLSVMSNWSGQIGMHIKQDHALRVLTYHGAGKRDQKPDEFEQYDIVITTYQTLALEWMPSGMKTSAAKPIPRSKGLFSLQWNRVVLDEGHIIRNPKAKLAQAACALLSHSRWILTGTPIVNNLKDLQSHVKFLRLSGGLEKPDVFSGTLIRPLKQGRPEATVLLQALMSTICLRRMKDMKFINLRLPELSSHKYAIPFHPKEREKYEAFQTEAKGLLIQYKTCKNTKGENTYSNLLEVLLRMRQTCNHWKLCGERVTNLMAILELNQKVKLTPENLKSLQGLLQLSIDSQEDCSICFETLHNPVITTCAHVFGGECIERVIETQQKCPMCRAQLENNEDLVKPVMEVGNAGIDFDTTSSKVEALLNILKASRKKGGTKTVVFSQWTSFLDIIEHQLSANGFGFCRLDGSMNATRRDEAMEALAKDPECTIMLASLAVCSVGLNLVAANQVILADSWWAPAIEDQAVDRVHRLGQTKPTTVFRLVLEGSIEERVLDIQQEKRKLAMMAFQEKTTKRGRETATRFADIERLLGK